MLLTQLKCLYAKSGRRAGRMFISRIFPSGCKTTTISTEVTVHRSPHSLHASSPSSDFTRRPEIFGEQLNPRPRHFCDANFLFLVQDSSSRLHHVHRRRNILSDSTVMGGELGGEDDLQCFLHWCDSVLGLLIRVPHGVVSLRSHWKIVQQVSHWTLDFHITFIS